MQIDLSRFRDTFFQESEDHITAMEAGLLRLEQEPAGAEVLNSVFRGAHSIKGAAGTFGFEDIVRFTHSMENLLDRMRAGELAASAERIGVLLRSLDTLRALLAAASDGSAAPSSTDSMLRELMLVQQSEHQSAPGGRLRDEDVRPCHQTKIYDIEFRPCADVFRHGLDPVLILRELSRTGRFLAIEPDSARVPELAHLDPETCYLAWRVRVETEQSADALRDLFAFVEDGSEISISASACGVPPREAVEPPVPNTGRTRDSSIRVATGKVDKLIDLVGELVIAESMTAELLTSFTPERLPALQQAFAEMERYTRELQERVMGIRMLPIGTIFGRYPRIVRDLATAFGKQMDLEVHGADTELDKGVVERMSDPLTHLIHNAIDHGIETAEERRAAGKPAAGRIRLQAFHQGGNVVVAVSDDGRGIETNRIRQKAIERGLISVSQELTESEIQAFIFQAGFSTAGEISEISGRGVGMDVVSKSVEQLNGSVRVISEPGAGTRVEIKLPLTLAILDGLLVRVGVQTWVLPLVSIMESMRPRRDHVNRIAGIGEVVTVRGEPVPLVRLHELFSIPNGVTNPERGLVVIVEHQGKRLALLVDELLGQQQVVIKSLEAHYRRVEGVVGATILGDGQAALILDVTGVMQLARSGPIAA